jgi:ppGpp synthetase/RelA/SpoT-type nucleotidyltranferase
MVSQEPLLNDLVVYLAGIRESLLQNPDRGQEIVFSRAQLRQCRGAFDRMIRRGEESLHRLCELLCNGFFAQYQLQSVVIGEVPSNGERFTLTQLISRHDLYSTIDLDLGSRQLRKLQYFDGESWLAPTLVANVVEYQPTEPNPSNIYKVISRIKAEEELWNKVVDEIFGLDALVTRDKQLRHLSRYVKDIFGIKIVVGTPGEALNLHGKLESLSFGEAELNRVGVDGMEGVRELVFVETKNYLRSSEKESGWEAMKSVVRWDGRMFEIQVQPLRNFWREREHLTRESHAGFKSRREQVRQQVSAQIPLFGFYQALLKWLFQNPDGPAPVFPGVSVLVRD